MYAHTDAVTCLASSPAYNVIVSGSRDCTAILWDLCRGIFIRQLRGHTAPVAAVAVNDLTGDIATCAATWLHVWSINGDKLASVNTCVGRADRMQQILCVTFSQAHEWDSGNVIMTGSTDGVARMWSIDYVQVPAEDSAIKVATPIEPRNRLPARLMKQINVASQDLSVGSPEKSLKKSGSESSLSEEGVLVEGGSAKEWVQGQHEEKETCSDDDDERITPPTEVVLRRPSRVNPAFRKSEGNDSIKFLCVIIFGVFD